MINMMLWIFTGLYVLAAVATVAMVGKERKRTTPEVAAIVVIINLALATLGALAALRVI